MTSLLISQRTTALNRLQSIHESPQEVETSVTYPIDPPSAFTAKSLGQMRVLADLDHDFRDYARIYSDYVKSILPLRVSGGNFNAWRDHFHHPLAIQDVLTARAMRGIIKDLERAKVRGGINAQIINKSAAWIKDIIYYLLQSGFSWHPPLLNPSDSDVCLEWWEGKKKLTVYISSDDIQCIRVWGVDINEDMDEAYVGEPVDFVQHWKWMIS